MFDEDAPLIDRLRDGDDLKSRHDAAAEIERLTARVQAAEAQLEADRTKTIEAVNALTDAFERRRWLIEGRGPYEWDDEQYQKEFSDALDEFETAMLPLRQIGKDWSGCPQTMAEVIAARMDQIKRAEAAEAAVKELDDCLSDFVFAYSMMRDTDPIDPIVDKVRELLDARAALGEEG